jgi:hypothetical protein
LSFKTKATRSRGPTPRRRRISTGMVTWPFVVTVERRSMRASVCPGNAYFLPHVTSRQTVVPGSTTCSARECGGSRGGGILGEPRLLR